MSKMVNAALIDGLVRELEAVDSCVIVGPRNMSAADIRDFRTKLRSEKYRIRWVKNDLARVALERAGMPGAGAVFDGASAVVFGGDGALGASRVVLEEIKKYKDKLVVHGGYFEGETLDAAGIDSLSRTPSRQEILAMVLSGIAGPLSELGQSLGGLLTEVHGLVEALVEKRGGADGAAPAEEAPSA